MYSLGVKSIKRLFAGPLLIGAGDGTVELVVETAPKIPKDSVVKMPSIPALRVVPYKRNV